MPVGRASRKQTSISTESMQNLRQDNNDKDDKNDLDEMPELDLKMEDVVPKRTLKRKQEIQDHIVDRG